MNPVSLLLPDFTIILIGLVLFRVTKWSQEFWTGAE